MLRAVQEISDYSSNDAASRFPNRAGSFRTDLKNPALEFIKAVWAALNDLEQLVSTTNDLIDNRIEAGADHASGAATLVGRAKAYVHVLRRF